MDGCLPGYRGQCTQTPPSLRDQGEVRSSGISPYAHDMVRYLRCMTLLCPPVSAVCVRVLCLGGWERALLELNWLSIIGEDAL
jgi:hypothetical protein